VTLTFLYLESPSLDWTLAAVLESSAAAEIPGKVSSVAPSNAASKAALRLRFVFFIVEHLALVDRAECPVWPSVAPDTFIDTDCEKRFRVVRDDK
jgi:hypothetical protein